MKLYRALGPLMLIFLFGACSNSNSTGVNDFKPSGLEDQLYSKDGREYKVSFQALYRTRYRNLEEADESYLNRDIQATTQFLFGPLTYRALGGIQKGAQIQIRMDQAFVQNHQVMVPYEYHGTWLLQSQALSQGSLELPLPFSVEGLRTPHWQTCTDMADEDHSTWGFFWYFWDPQRPGCEHKAGTHYQLVKIQTGEETPQTKMSYPEYQRMIHMEDGVPTLAMTFAFGYVKEVANPKPFTDSDFGMREFQKFYREVKSQAQALGFSESPIRQSDITFGSTVIGTQFLGLKNGVRVRISVVAAAGVDQMDIFAHSYARQHEGFFGWFGHSRVGSGFDADLLKEKLDFAPREFSITPEYQLVYWAGCNSYSYYTNPFFDLKASLNPQEDPHGTRSLDLISNALPSLFAFNAANAKILFTALLNWEKPTSYQSLIDQIETFANSWGSEVIVNVLGDEDNS